MSNVYHTGNHCDPNYKRFAHAQILHCTMFDRCRSERWNWNNSVVRPLTIWGFITTCVTISEIIEHGDWVAHVIWYKGLSTVSNLEWNSSRYKSLKTLKVDCEWCECFNCGSCNMNFIGILQAWWFTHNLECLRRRFKRVDDLHRRSAGRVRATVFFVGH